MRASLLLRRVRHAPGSASGTLRACGVRRLLPCALLSAAACFLSAASGAAQDVVISEILAVGGGLEDADGDTPDWVEIQNRGVQDVQLEGWHLTDEPGNLRKWTFPRLTLPAGAFAIVFASGKDRAVAGQELHASFQLSSDGEYLALVRSDGVTIADALDPRYPPQYDDISYGIALDVSRTDLVAQGDSARIRVPASDPGTGWRLPGYNDASWSAGPTGVGYDRTQGADPPPEELTNVAPLGTASQSSTLSGYPASLAINGSFADFTHTSAGSNLPATWQVDLGTERTIHRIVLHNRQGCCPSRLRDIRVSVLDAPGGTVLYQSELLNPENVLGGGTSSDGPASLDLDLLDLTGGPVPGRVVRVVRTPDPDLSGTGGVGNNDEHDVLSLGEVEVFEGPAGFGSEIATDVEAAMSGVRASIYLRLPFQLASLGGIDRLRLRIKYDAGFVAWLNGQEISRRNAPASLQWNSAATAERTYSEAVAFEDIDVTAHAASLLAGSNVLAIQGLNSAAADEDFLILPELVADSILGEQRKYFLTPTPGAPNDTESVVGLVEDTQFSHRRGFHESPFDVAITTATEGATIRYTLDGTPPTEANGLAYTGPIRVQRTTTLRARAFKGGYRETNVDTQTYIFLDDVIRQTPAATIAAGFPSTWGGTSPDYGMDTDVVGPGDLYGGAYAATIRQDLKSLPTLSIVLDIDDMFGPDGLYTNSTADDDRFERPASVEIFYPDREEDVQVDCGVRIQGGYFRQHSATRKHSLRLVFRREYGPARLRTRLFGPRATDSFDTLTLRAGANDGYSWDAARLTEQYVRDEFGRSLQRDTGNAAGHGMFVHLYINGIYWGLYNPVERPDHAFSASYYGGEKEDWDSVHDSAATNGDLTAWSRMLQQAGAAGSSLAEYQELQGRNVDGSSNPAYPHLLDVPNYADYMIVNFWGGNWDWPGKNFWAARYRLADSTGFKFYCWDYENTMGNNRDRSPLTKNAIQPSLPAAGQAHSSLSGNPEYRLLFADRVHRLFFDGGILEPDSLIARYRKLADRVERSIVGESARWGDQHYNPPLGLAEWRTERNWILGTYLPQRTGIVLGQMRAAGLYPSVEAPSFSRRGGLVDAGASVLIAAPAGAVYYTTDGTDPRVLGGAVSPGAFTTGEVETSVILEAGASARYLVPGDGNLGLTWTQRGFDDSSWLSGTSAIGFEAGTGYEALIETDVESLMYQTRSSVYIRIPFDLDPGLFSGESADLAALRLGVKYDDGYVAYLNGTFIVSRNAPDPAIWSSAANASHADNLAIEFEEVAVDAAIPLLRPGTNVLAIHALNSSAGSTDFLVVPRLSAASSAGAGGVTVETAMTLKARALVGGTWSALAEARYVVDVPLRVTEVMYHPAPFGDGLFEEADFEFIELQNVGGTSLSLAGIRIEGGIQFDFALSTVTTLRPGGIIVLVKDIGAFSLRYGLSAAVVAGEFAGRLDNLGDIVILRGPSGDAILDFEFDDLWVPETDGTGTSLVVVDPLQSPSTWSEASVWKASEYPFGSPGIDESGGGVLTGWQVPGDLNQDAHVDISDAVALLLHLFAGGGPELPCGDGTPSAPGNLALVDSNADGTVDVTDVLHVLNYLFRDGSAPALGVECTRLDGCPDVCF